MAFFEVLVVVVLILSLAVLLIRVFYNRALPAFDRRHREGDDSFLFNFYCETGIMTKVRWLNRRLPSSPRCRVCLLPFGGLGRLLGVQPSRKNPNHCRSCFEAAPIGAHDMEVGILFADIRGYTAWCEDKSPEVVERALNRFYATASTVLTKGDGLIDKLVGDAVIALFIPAFRSLQERTCEIMVDAARDFLLLIGQASPDHDALPVGVGLTYGVARVGNVGAGEVKDFTAIGDVVNTAARLEASASPGQILMSAEVYERAAAQVPNATPQSLLLKGKAEPVSAYAVQVGCD